MNIKKPIYAWFAIYTKPNREKKIVENLRENNIECYLPLQRTLKQWSDRKKWVEEPLFKSYVFVKVSYIEFYDVLHCQGVVKYISFGGKPQAIPEYQIENIRSLLRQKELDLVVTHERISRGDKAVVQYGPLQGIQGEVVQIFGQSRILVRIDTIGCSLYTNIDMHEVKFINEGLNVNMESKSYFRPQEARRAHQKLALN